MFHDVRRSLPRPSLELLQLLPDEARLYDDPSAPHLESGTWLDGFPILVSTRQFVIVHDWLDVWLCPEDRKPIAIGTHYGEPSAVGVARSREWCASGGCGVVVYYLRYPYRRFRSGVPSDQWWEIGRDEDDPWHVDRLRVLGEDHLRVDVDPQTSHGGVYDLNVRRRTVRRLRLSPAPRLWS